MFKPGDKIRLKKSVTENDLMDISLGEDSIDWIFNQKELVVSALQRPDTRNKVYFVNRGSLCYYLKSNMVELVNSEPRGHRMTRIFA